ncbi:MAG: DUF2034 domain-containing protein [Desulfobacterales bacterium]|jgi:restriction system protein
MARKNQSILNQLVILPWWVCLALAAILYIFLKTVLPVFSFDNFVFNAFARAATGFAPLISFILLVTAAVAAFNQLRKGKMLESVSGSESIQSLNWREFEELVAEAFRRKGYFVLENPEKGPDGGVDIRLRKNGNLILVQCKHWKSGKVGVKTVRELYGVMAAKQAYAGIIVTFGTFTEDAKKFATGKSIELISGNQLLKLISSVQKNQQVSKSDNEIRVPTCPKCGSEMKLRIARKGKHAGQEFWGCSNYPDCRGILAYKN